jgi:UDPglucose 6-dehydrogenase
MKISVVGGGYVGLVSGACLADLGHEVTIIDTDPEKVRLINKGQCPFYEQGLDGLLGRYAGTSLSATTAYASVGGADIVFICVGTPPDADGSADLQFIRSAAVAIGNELNNARQYPVVAVKSTVPPGTTETVVRPAVLQAAGKSGQEIGFVMNPEFLREGRAVADFMHPDRIVIGSDGPGARAIVTRAYAGIPAPVVQTGIREAEMIKYVSNAFLATKISFANETGNLCKRLGIDVYEVMKGVGLDARIGPQFLNAGAGYGGSCFPKDVSALISLAERIGEDPVLLKSANSINERQPHRMVALLQKRAGSLAGKRIAVLGLAFKDNTDDIRDSRAIPVIRDLLQAGVVVTAYDPMAVPNMKKVFPALTYCSTAADALRGADGCLVMTEWPEFEQLGREFDLMADRIIIEGRRILSCDGAEGICW